MRIFVADKTNKTMKQLTQEQLEQVYREHPEWLTEIEVGKWYKLLDSDWLLFYVTELIDTKYVRGYGWDINGKWYCEEVATWDANNAVPATDAEVASALISEAKRRYRDGDKVDRFDSRYLGDGNSMVIQRLEDSFMESDGSIWVYSDNDFSICLFKNGKWATVITPASALAEDIQALKDKYPNYNWTIIAESK